MPVWALALAFWLHMAATVVWIGGLFYQAVLLAPAIEGHLSPELGRRLLQALRRRFTPLAWLSLAVLVGTGLMQMAGNPNYEGFLSIQNLWARAILTKHVAILGMVIIAVYQTWFIQPQIERALLRRAMQPERGDEAAPLLSRQVRLHRWNFILGILVLALTALARTA